MLREMSYPATFNVNTPDRVANWRPIVQWLLAIPHYIVLIVLSILSGLVGIAAWLAVVFTGRLPSGIAGFQAMVTRYGVRTFAYAFFLTDQYPPFDFTTSTADPGGHASSVSFSPSLEGRNRLMVLFRFVVPISVISNLSTNEVSIAGWLWIAAIILAITLIPSSVYTVIVGIVAFVCAVLGFFAVLFTGRWPSGLHRLVVGSFLVDVRFSAYAALLTDEHPPFSIN